MRINTRARQIIEKVKAEHDLTFEQMAEECDVATGSIQRWYSTGRAKADKIRPLEEMIANTRIPAHKIAENLIEIYRHVRRPISLLHNQLRDMTGRERLSESVIEEVTEELYERDFILVQDLDDDGRLAFFVVRKKWLTKKTRKVDEKILKEYYKKVVEDEFEEEEDD